MTSLVTSTVGRRVRCLSSSSNRNNAHLLLLLMARRGKSSRPEPSSVFDSATDFFSSLRYKAANALTASLPENERKELFEHIINKPTTTSTTANKNDETETTAAVVEDTTTHSIAEAVAAARVQEARRQEEKWEKEKGKILAQAEQAARARVESDLAIQQRRIAFEKWKQQQIDEQQKEQQQEQEQQNNSKPSAVVVENEETVVADDHHPILGEAIVDLGYKRVHVVSSKALASIPVWKKQRIYRHDRAKSMAADKQKTIHLGMPGVIGLHEDSKGKLAILDGQHRVGMMTIMEEKAASGEQLDLGRILVEVYPQMEDHGDSHAQDIFLEINKAEPIKLVDMPGVAKSADRKTINDGAATLQERYPEMFSPSQRCRAPHLNIDNLRDALFAADVIKRHNLKSAKALHAWMMEQNDVLAKKYQNDGEAQEKVSKTALAKANKFKFYLGLESSWLYK